MSEKYIVDLWNILTTEEAVLALQGNLHKFEGQKLIAACSLIRVFVADIYFAEKENKCIDWSWYSDFVIFVTIRENNTINWLRVKHLNTRQWLLEATKYKAFINPDHTERQMPRYLVNGGNSSFAFNFVFIST